MSAAAPAGACGGGRLLVDGPAGALEVQVDCPAAACPGVAVVGHPHPLYGGSLDNKVAHILARAAGDLDLPAVRFNFRGVGRSEGAFDQGRGEADDMAAVAAWARERFPGPLLLAGFSFGAWVAWRLHPALAPRALALVAPPVSLYDFGRPVEAACPWLVVQGSDDEVVDAAAVRAWAEARDPAPVLAWLEGAGHFFHGRLNEVRAAVREAWREVLE